MAKPNIDTIEGVKERGSILIFPSDIYHRVTPIKKGIRYSLVTWFFRTSF
jgi:predicted 2-oxoglutarate/Fe(II)-dependent dioxygenase YbiX